MQGSKGITKIRYVENIPNSDTPARVNRLTGEMVIQNRVWRHIHPLHRIFILLHEEGHVVLQTTDELEADKYAFERYAELGYPLKHSILALAHVLTFTSREHFLRGYAQADRALQYDQDLKLNPHERH